MIPQEQQVTNLDLSKRLAAAGVPQKSLWYWVLDEINEDDCGFQCDEHGNKWYLWYRPQNYFDISGVMVSAFTPAELGEWLPPYFRTYKFNRNDGLGYGYACENEIDEGSWDEDEWERMTATGFYADFVYQEADTLADAMGEMLLYLIEKGYVKVKELK